MFSPCSKSRGWATQNWYEQWQLIVPPLFFLEPLWQHVLLGWTDAAGKTLFHFKPRSYTTYHQLQYVQWLSYMTTQKINHTCFHFCFDVSRCCGRRRRLSSQPRRCRLCHWSHSGAIAKLINFKATSNMKHKPAKDASKPTKGGPRP